MEWTTGTQQPLSINLEWALCKFLLIDIKYINEKPFRKLLYTLETT